MTIERKREQWRRWAKANPDRLREHKRRARLKYSHGLTESEYAVLLEEQDGRCAICRQAPPREKVLNVDHCHETGVLRGLLCGNCNVALGMAGDSPERLRSMIDYLETARPSSDKLVELLANCDSKAVAA